jgi:murein DD-endopeptidase MepM/ murein hydrolase activator NlpD
MGNECGSGCFGSDNCPPDGVSGPETPGVGVTDTTVAITPAGGKISLPGFGSVEFFPGAFASNVTVSASIDTEPETNRIFLETAPLITDPTRLSYELRVTYLGPQPQVPAKISLVIPAEFSTQIPNNQRIVAFAKRLDSGEFASFPVFDAFASRLSPDGSSVSLALPSWAFTQLGDNNLHEAIILLAAVEDIEAVVLDTLPKIPGMSLAASGECLGPTIGSPLSVPVTDGLISKPRGVFGPRINPKTGDQDFHGGVDIAVEVGTPVKAVADGEVLVRDNKNKGYGLYILHHYVDPVLRRTDYEFVYAHLSEVRVPRNRWVQVHRAQTIALTGQSGRATGPHLHFEYRASRKIVPDPIRDAPPLEQDIILFHFPVLPCIGIPLGRLTGSWTGWIGQNLGIDQTTGEIVQLVNGDANLRATSLSINASGEYSVFQLPVQPVHLSSGVVTSVTGDGVLEFKQTSGSLTGAFSWPFHYWSGFDAFIVTGLPEFTQNGRRLRPWFMFHR